MRHTPSLSKLLWTLNTLLCVTACYQSESTGFPPPSAAGNAGAPALDACPTRPLSDLCGQDGARPVAESGSLQRCPATFALVQQVQVSLGNGTSAPAAFECAANSCGGTSVPIVTISDSTQYDFDVDGLLIGAQRSDHSAQGTCATQRYGMTCSVVAELLPCTGVATGSTQ